MHQVKGKIKEINGKAVGNKDLEADGKGENLKGKAQEMVGDVKKVGENREGILVFRHSLGTRKLWTSILN